MIRRLLHALGWHWWTDWETYEEYNWLEPWVPRWYKIVALIMMIDPKIISQHRECQMCNAIDERSIEARRS